MVAIVGFTRRLNPGTGVPGVSSRSTATLIGSPSIFLCLSSPVESRLSQPLSCFFRTLPPSHGCYWVEPCSSYWVQRSEHGCTDRAMTALRYLAEIPQSPDLNRFGVGPWKNSDCRIMRPISEATHRRSGAEP